MVIPGLTLPAPEDLLFFDLETTGLSGGAGTIAFLAAFGRLVPAAGAGDSAVLELHVTQYLLLDYPGENDFLEALLGEFDKERRLVVTYNGKSFDSQILKTRCLMNGMRPPEYLHADLLHPARRLWKRLLADCSQGTIETEILGIDRRGDTPGALAPEIWFSFLKDGDTGRLMDICAHNRKDILGLAAIFALMSQIASDPCGMLKTYRYDVEMLALRWRDLVRKEQSVCETCEAGGNAALGQKLLRFAARKKNCPQAAFAYALDLLRGGGYTEGRKRLLAIVSAGYPDDLRAASLRALAIDSEWRIGDLTEALALVKRGLELLPAENIRRAEFERREERLKRKVLRMEL
ncbi:hypothetical protein AGMMS50293_16300 [Spirochaetia bacterium]|nr:hypothetical protein AGMMS50293_16300 [Spirochaetia bacterium]